VSAAKGDLATPPPSSARRRNRWLAIGAVGVALAAILAFLLAGLGQNLVYYWGPTELRAAGERAIGATIRLGGQVVPGSVLRGEGASGIEFDVADRKGGRVHVKAVGVPPQMFREGIGVVVEGTMTRAGHFEGQRLMVSHGSDYRAPHDGEDVDVRKLIESANGLEGGKKR
jgi:cytochrome c-type biogenesis protein CcmE